MAPSLGVVMDPIATIKPYKDSTLAMLLAAQARGWPLWYMELGDLYLAGDRCHGRMRALMVRDDPHDWFTLGAVRDAPLDELPAVLMRKDPPVDMEYIHATQLLELAERRGSLIVNRPAALRDLNEKLATAWFPQCCVPTLVTRDMAQLGEFVAAQGDAIVKPLDAMGGTSVFRVRAGDPNRNVIFETLTDQGRRYAMVQRFIPEISAGDKRILLIDGEPVAYALARVPQGCSAVRARPLDRGTGRPRAARARRAVRGDRRHRRLPHRGEHHQPDLHPRARRPVRARHRGGPDRADRGEVGRAIMRSMTAPTTP
jgi:glutathione synthase